MSRFLDWGAAMKHSSRKLRYCSFAMPGLTAGVIGLTLGVFLASPENGWQMAMFYSIIGLVGAPLATLAWGTSNLRRAQSFSGVSLLAGILGTMAILLELTTQHATVMEALVRAPLAFASWIVIWALWISIALTKLVLFEPAYTRRQSLPR